MDKVCMYRQLNTVIQIHYKFSNYWHFISFTRSLSMTITCSCLTHALRFLPLMVNPIHSHARDAYRTKTKLRQTETRHKIKWRPHAAEVQEIAMLSLDWCETRSWRPAVWFFAKLNSSKENHSLTHDQVKSCINGVLFQPTIVFVMLLASPMFHCALCKCLEEHCTNNS